jgi:hypothetical protein
MPLFLAEEISSRQKTYQPQAIAWRAKKHAMTARIHDGGCDIIA